MPKTCQYFLDNPLKRISSTKHNGSEQTSCHVVVFVIPNELGKQICTIYPFKTIPIKLKNIFLIIAVQKNYFFFVQLEIPSHNSCFENCKNKFRPKFSRADSSIVLVFFLLHFDFVFSIFVSNFCLFQDFFFVLKNLFALFVRKY